MGLLTVQLEQDAKKHVFTSGDTVRGTVYYIIQGEQEELSDVSLIFSGKIKTTVVQRKGNGNGAAHNRHYKEKIQLFNTVIPLFRGPYDMGPQTLEWPFEVQFPTSCSYSRKHEDGDAKYAPSGESLPLPPTFAFSAARCDAKVAYTVKVKLNQRTLTRRSKHNDSLLFSPFTGAPPPDLTLETSTFPIAHWSSRELRPGKHDFKQKMKHVFSSDPSLKTPEINFQARIGLPTKMSPGQVAPLQFWLMYNRQNDVDPVAPTLVLESIRLALKTYTVCRASGTFSDHQKEDTGAETLVLYKPNVPLPLDGTCVYPIADFGVHSFKRSVNTNASGPAHRWLAPDFISWTINHSHYLKAYIIIRHKESNYTFDLKTERLPFQFYPPGDRTTLDFMWNTPETAPRDGELPAYTAPVAGSSTAPPPEYNEPSTEYVGEKQAEMRTASKVM